MSAKVIFLDFDGVLSTLDWLYSQGSDSVCPENVRHLTTILEKTGALVVVSSVWRFKHPLPVLRAILETAGMPEALAERLVSVTPRGSQERGNEIQEWMDANFTPSSFAILDDSSDMAHLSSYLVKTDIKVGLTAEKADEALKLLGC